MGDVDLDALASDLGFVMKSEQKGSCGIAYQGKRCFWCAANRLWKKPDFQVFVMVKNRASNSPNAASVERPTIIVICPLKSK